MFMLTRFLIRCGFIVSCEVQSCRMGSLDSLLLMFMMQCVLFMFFGVCRTDEPFRPELIERRPLALRGSSHGPHCGAGGVPGADHAEAGSAADPHGRPARAPHCRLESSRGGARATRAPEAEVQVALSQSLIEFVVFVGELLGFCGGGFGGRRGDCAGSGVRGSAASGGR